VSSRLEGKVAIVTGSNRGIGRAIAWRLARDGARVVLCARDRRLLDETAGQMDGSCVVMALDLRTTDAPPRLADFAIETFGRIDILVNNAGATRRGDFETLTEEDWQDGFALKFFGAVRLTRAAWPHLKQTGGSVVNIAGIGGRTPGPEFTIGGSVNAALLSFTKAMADVGIRDAVQVNAINPGTVRTERFARRLGDRPEQDYVRAANVTRIGEPEDIAALVAFLVGPEGRFLQGALIDMDGGQTKTL
jgi:3-oxoacyl-[acyl-carrier protein] reductase